MTYAIGIALLLLPLFVLDLYNNATDGGEARP